MKKNKKDDGELPASWRPEWREPKRRRGRGAKPAVLLPATGAALPPDDEIRSIAVSSLLELVRDDDAEASARVGAAKALIELTKPKEDIETGDRDRDLSAAELLEASQWIKAIQHENAKGTE